MNSWNTVKSNWRMRETFATDDRCSLKPSRDEKVAVSGLPGRRFNSPFAPAPPTCPRRPNFLKRPRLLAMDMSDFHLSRAAAPCIEFHVTCIFTTSAGQRPEFDFSWLVEAPTRPWTLRRKTPRMESRRVRGWEADKKKSQLSAASISEPPSRL